MLSSSARKELASLDPDERVEVLGLFFRDELICFQEAVDASNEALYFGYNRNSLHRNRYRSLSNRCLLANQKAYSLLNRADLRAGSNG